MDSGRVQNPHRWKRKHLRGQPANYLLWSGVARHFQAFRLWWFIKNKSQTKYSSYNFNSKDLDKKVVHLVQRAPPNASTRNVRSLTPPPDVNRSRTGFRGFDRAGNPVSHMYVGSMTLPQNLMEPPQVVPPRATHTLSSSRLNVARRFASCFCLFIVRNK